MEHNAENQYLDIMKDILKNGDLKKNRTGVDTKDLFGVSLRHDYELGFPLLTTKKMFIRGAIQELLWFLRGDTNIKSLKESGVNFWNAWADPDGNLGPVYGYQLRSQEKSFLVKPKIFEPHNNAIDFNFSKDFKIDYTHHKTSLLGKEIEAPDGKFIVIKEVPNDPNYNHRTSFIVKFLKDGAEVKTSYASVQGATVENPYKISYLCGCYGNYDKTDINLSLLKNCWRDMLKRCYDKNHKAYSSYGAKGIHVDKSWLVFENFQRDVKQIRNWNLKKTFPKKYSLDKDVLFGSNRYSKETCCWASKLEQSYNTSTARPFQAASPTGRVVLFKSFGEAEKKFNLNISAVHRCLNGDLKTHHGWREFKYKDFSPFILRTKVNDQLVNVIESIKNNPNSRRHIISLWNSQDLPEMRLPPCHGLVVQFNVRPSDKLSDYNGHLDISVCQRSSDWFLGVPVNIASYSFLLYMIADVTGLKPGRMYYTFGSAHIYMNHIDQCNEQLKNSVLPCPKLELNHRDNIDDFVFDDFEIKNYKSAKTIKAAVAV